MTVTITYSSTLSQSDPQSHPVLIVGQLKHLRALKFDQVACKLQPRVTAEVQTNNALYLLVIYYNKCCSSRLFQQLCAA